MNEMVELASEYGRYGYRRITALLRQRGWRVNHKRVERLWRREGLKVPRKQPKRRRLWLNDGSCVRRRPERKNHVWSYDFVQTRTAEGRAVRLLTLMDEYTRECLAIRVGRKLGSEEVIETLADLFVRRGVPEYLRSDNGPEFVAKILREWLARLQVQTLYIEPGSPWETATSNRSTASCATSCSIWRSSTRSTKRRCWWSTGAWSTTRGGRTVHWAIGHPHRRRSSRLQRATGLRPCPRRERPRS